MTGKTLKELGVTADLVASDISVKESVFPFRKFAGVDIVLGPEMRSTGEVMGVSDQFPMAFAKSQLGAGIELPDGGRVFMSVRGVHKDRAAKIAKQIHELGYEIIATQGTAKRLADDGIPV